MRSTSESNRNKYVQNLYQFQNRAYEKAKLESDALNLTGISISTAEALTVQFLLSTWKSLKHVEIGTLTGYSALAAAFAIGNKGQVWTFEKNELHIAAAQRVFDLLNSIDHPAAAQIHLCAGDAQLELVKIENQGPFDSIFIDGNKAAYGNYLAWAEKNIRKGGLIIADNVFLSGSVYEDVENSKFSSKQIDVLKKFNERLANPQFYRSCLIPTSEGLFVAEKLF